MTTAWRSLHVFIGARAHGDKLVLLADQVLRASAPDPSDWFFIRYGEAGAHLRIRLGPGTQPATDLLSEALQAEAATLARASPDADWTRRAGYRDAGGRFFSPGELVAITYEPEVQRYGGRAALPVNEALFRRSSAIAIRAIALTPAMVGRTAVAIDLMLAAAAALSDVRNPTTLFEGYAQGWSRLLAAPDENRGPDVAAGSGVRDRLAVRQAELTAGLAPSDLGGHWAMAVAATIERCRAIAADDDLVMPWSGTIADAGSIDRAVGDMMMSQVHMLANRLGYSPHDELRWSRCLAAALA